MVAAKEKGLVRSEGKEYVMQDGDIVLFKFNVSKQILQKLVYQKSQGNKTVIFLKYKCNIKTKKST